MPSITIPEIDFVNEATKMISSSKRLKGTNLRKFRAIFGVSNSICNLVWAKIHSTHRFLQPKHLLWALLFLKCYATEYVNSIISNSDCKTYRLWTWRINFSERLKDPSFGDCWLSIDGTDCSIMEPFPFHRKWFSHKLKKAAVRYEVAISIKSGNICWANGPFPAGSFPDLCIFRNDLKSNLLFSEKVIADKGYRGEPSCIIYGTSRRNTSLIKKIRARHETLNRRLKTFFVLQHRFRHDRRKHGLCFHAVANLVQLTLINSPLFSIQGL